MNINQQILNVFNEVSTDIPKDAVNQHFNYRYVSVDKLFMHIRKTMCKHGIFLSLNEVEFSLQKHEKYNARAGRVVPYYMAVAKFEAFFTNKEGQRSEAEHITQVATVDKEQDTGKLQSYAAKYFLRRVFLLPLGEKDMDYATQPLNPMPPQGYVNVGVTESDGEAQQANALLTQISQLGFSDPKEVAQWIVGERGDLDKSKRIELIRRWINLIGSTQLPNIADLITEAREGGRSMMEVMEMLGLIAKKSTPEAQPEETPQQAPQVAESDRTLENAIEMGRQQAMQREEETKPSPQTVPERREALAKWMKSKDMIHISEQKYFLSWVTGIVNITLSKCTSTMLDDIETFIEAVPADWKIKLIVEKAIQDSETVNTWIERELSHLNINFNRRDNEQ